MKTENSVLRENARLQLSGNLGQGILATIVPFILALIANAIVGGIVRDTSMIYQIISMTTTAVATFMTITMVMNLHNGNPSADFGNSLSPGDKLGKFVLYSVILAIITILINVPTNLIFFDSWLGNANDIQVAIDNFSSDMEGLLSFMFGYLGVTFVGLIIITVLLIRLTFVTYILVDEEISIMDAVRKSIRITKGNFWRIIGMSLSFIGWFLLIIITCGIAAFYVAPYYQMAMMKLYFAIKFENSGESGDSHDNGYNNYNRVQQDWAEETIVEKEEEKPNDRNNNSWDF